MIVSSDDGDRPATPSSIDCPVAAGSSEVVHDSHRYW
jgi:hypothetical protein